MNNFVWFVCFAASSVQAAPFVSVDGRLLVDGAGRDDVVDVAVDVRGDDGLARLTHIEPGVVIVDGAFAFDLDIAAIEQDLAAGETLLVDVTVGDLSSTAVLGRVYGANEAARADVASTAATATALGAIDGASLVAAAGIGVAGGVSIAFANLVDLPPGVGDGFDNGTLDAVGAGLSITGGTLRLTTISSAQIVDGTVPASAIAAGSITTTQLAGIQPADVAAATLTGASLVDGLLTSTSDISGDKLALFLRNRACTALSDETRDQLTTSPTCTRRSCTDGGAGFVRCGTAGECVLGAGGTCSNERLGHLVFAN